MFEKPFLQPARPNLQKAFFKHAPGHIKKILSKFKIPGFCNVQFIKTKSGENYFIELNPRFGGFSISSSLSSINMVELFLKLGNIDNNYEENMSKVKWNSIVTRYYEEVVYNEE